MCSLIDFIRTDELGVVKLDRQRIQIEGAIGHFTNISIKGKSINFKIWSLRIDI